jgi:glycosyltransferase involved in cell wall biosynthesis
MGTRIAARVSSVSPVRIVLNARSDSAGAQAGVVGLGRRLQEAGVDATLGDWEHYDRYDVAIFLGTDEDVARARAAHPGIRIGLSDPKQSRREWVDAARAADFLLVSSVEQREAFLRLNRNLHVLYMFPPLPARERRHEQREPLVVGYHGNRVHLEAMRGTGVRDALEAIGRRRPIELVAVYDVAGKGRVSERALPDPSVVPTRHVQWTEDALLRELDDMDIGLVPNLLPVENRGRALRLTASSDPELLYEPFDHLLRLKASSNPNRLYAFAQRGVPVVADITPSYAQFVLDGVSGLLAASARGWFEALDRLSASADLRGDLARELRSRIDAAYARQVDDLLAFLAAPGRGAPPRLPGDREPESDLATLAAYPAPGRESGAARLVGRLRRLVG